MPLAKPTQSKRVLKAIQSRCDRDPTREYIQNHCSDRAPKSSRQISQTKTTITKKGAVALRKSFTDSLTHVTLCQATIVTPFQQTKKRRVNAYKKTRKYTTLDKNRNSPSPPTQPTTTAVNEKILE